MIYLPGRLLFVHVPRCAGTWLKREVVRELSLVGYAPLAVRDATGEGDGKPRKLHPHEPLGVLLEHLDAGEAQRTWRVAFVRNPWSWVVSLWRYCRQDARGDPTKRMRRGLRSLGLARAEREQLARAALAMPFPEWLAWARASRWNPWPMEVGERGIVDVPAVWWLNGCDDVFDLHADLHAFVDQCRRRFGWSLDASRRSNASGDGEWRRCYDDESLATVAQAHEKTISRFGYRPDAPA